MKKNHLREKSLSRKIRKGDNVVVIAGNDRGKTGIVKSTIEDRVVVHGVNMRKKHIKRTQEMPKGRIVDFECPIHISNVKICIGENQGVKLKVRTDESGQRHYVYKNGEDEVIYRSVKKPK